MLHGKKIIITSGPTRVSLDAVRFLSNVSTGHFGSLLAKEALKQGAIVTFIYGKGSVLPKSHPRLKILPIETNEDLKKILRHEIKKKKHDAIIHAMAVLDFQPERLSKIKTKTKDGVWNLKLVPTKKIIQQIKKWDPNIFLVGFKLEVGISQEKLFAAAKRLLRQSRANLVLANQLTEGADAQHQGWLLNAKGEIVLKGKGKDQLSRRLIQKLSEDF